MATELNHPLDETNSISLGTLLETSPPLTHHYSYQDVRVSDEDRFQHVYMVGQTGAGKSNTIKHMLAQDLQNPQKGVIVISPEAGFLEDMLPHIPENRRDDLLYFDPRESYRENLESWFASHTPPWRDLLARPRIIFIDLSQIGTPAKETVAELILAEIEMEIIRREQSKREKVPYYLYIEEFADCIRAGESTNELFAKARKNCLGFTLAHQTRAYLTDELESVIRANVKTMMIMNVSAQDASFFAQVLEESSQGSANPSILQNLWPGQAIVRLETDGVQQCVAVNIPLFK
jgi:hypothetical protein